MKHKYKYNIDAKWFALNLIHFRYIFLGKQNSNWFNWMRWATFFKASKERINHFLLPCWKLYKPIAQQAYLDIIG